MVKEQILKSLFLRKRQLPTLPVIFAEFTKLINKPFVSTRQIAELIKKDQSMVAKILQLSNSALYSKRQKINNLANAITYLGTETLKNIILQICLVRMFKFELCAIPDFNPASFWEHSLGTAYFSDILAHKLKLPHDENYYIGGLLHDIGKVLTYQFYPEKFEETVLEQIEEECPDYVAEKEVLGVDHSDIGGFLAEHWNFKREIINTIENHHKLLMSRLDVVTAVVSISNLFSKRAGLCFPWDDKSVDIANYEGWQRLMEINNMQIDIDQVTLGLSEQADDLRESVQTLLAEL
jgi:putative nucleotidyltransferase with HDIG domain